MFLYTSFTLSYIFLRYILWQSCYGLSSALYHTLTHIDTMGKHCHLLLRVQSSIWMQWHIQVFWKWQHLFIREREISFKEPTMLCQVRSGPVNWLLLTNKAAKSSIVHLFLYANEVQTQHALSFVSSPHPPSSLSLSNRRFWCEDAMTGLLSFSLCSWHERCDRSQDQEAVMGSWESDCKHTHTHLQVSPHTPPNEG